MRQTITVFDNVAEAQGALEALLASTAEFHGSYHLTELQAPSEEVRGLFAITVFREGRSVGFWRDEGGQIRAEVVGGYVP